jgi:thermitase
MQSPQKQITLVVFLRAKKQFLVQNKGGCKLNKFILLPIMLALIQSSIARADSPWFLKQIQAENAHKTARASVINQKITVAVIDTGLDLNNNFQIDPRSQSFCGDELKDNSGHGTHIAGLIHQINPHANLLILKYWDPLNSKCESLQNLISALKYAIYSNVDIINYSGGGTLPSREELQLLLLAEKKGILVVAAAGNNGQNNDDQPFYPASYNLKNILSVGSLTEDGAWARTSNWSLQKVQLAAPGQNIWSQIPGNKYAFMSGTSQATAIVTGVASLYLGHRLGKIPPEKTILHLVNNGVSDQRNAGRTKFGKKVNAARSIARANENENAFGIWITDSDEKKLGAEIEAKYEK